MTKICTKEQAKQQLIDAAKSLHRLGYLAACDGNLSFRLSDQEILITPSGVPKHKLTGDDFAVINLDGQIIHGRPSSERSLHLEVYRNCPKARSVIHSHPPCAIAWSLVNPDQAALPIDALGEVILACGGIPQAEFAIPGSADLANSIKPFLPNYRVMILSRHGALSWGEDIDEAYRGTERLEHAARVLKEAACFGKVVPMSSSQVKELKKLRLEIGDIVL